MNYTVSAADLGSVRLGEDDTVQSVLQNIALILATPRGSSAMYRDFGLSQAFLDRPLPAAKALMRVQVKEAIEEWEPRAAYVDMVFREDSQPGEPGALTPVVTVEIKGE